MDFLEAAYFSESNRSGPNLSHFGFRAPIRWPQMKKVEPDYLLIEPGRQYCLIVDVKSGYIQHDDWKQAEAYRSIPLYEIVDVCEKISKARGWPNPNIRSFDVCFQYYAHIVKDAELSRYAIPKDIEQLKERATIVVVDTEAKRWQIWSGSSRPLGVTELQMLLQAGLVIPSDPAPSVLLTAHPSDELVVLALCDAVLHRRARQKPVLLSPQKVREEIFASYPQVTLAKIQTLLNKIRQYGLCSIPRQGSTGFQTEYLFDRPEDLIPHVIDQLYSGRSVDELGTKK